MVQTVAVIPIAKNNVSDTMMQTIELVLNDANTAKDTYGHKHCLWYIMMQTTPGIGSVANNAIGT